MLEKRDSLNIPILCQYGIVNLCIVPVNKDRDFLYEVVDSCSEEIVYHLVEGSNYQYEFNSIGNVQFQFKENTEIVTRSNLPNRKNQGTIRTGIYVGQLTLLICELSRNTEVGRVKLEIRSVKADYEGDYRTMLDEIAEYYADLVLMQGSPVTQTLEVDENCNSQTLYQKFSFVRSIIDSDSFQTAIHKIIQNPVRKWTDIAIEKDICGVKRFSKRNIRQIVTSKDRILLPPDSCLKAKGIDTIPRKVSVDYKCDTIDNHENQFVKFALRTFSMFCLELKDKKNASERLKNEIGRTVNQISTYLDSHFFRQISMPTYLNMNSPVLQRKEGYREVLQAWVVFDLAAKLNWSGGNDVYEAGKKNVATLYEYWLFFKLQELIGEFFQINQKDKRKLVNIDNDKIDLQIIQGKKVILRGKSSSSMRELNVAFYYNRTFSKVADNEDPIHKAGSWTMSMRPDYTLSIWPGNISEEQAEAEDLITHIHFDAKYRLNKVLLEDDAECDSVQKLSEEKKQQEMGIYKRADLLKMHAYKDAIRRTSGAYVLYPGTENKEIKGFHEVVPGLGAFSIRPGHWGQDSIYLKQFLAEVKAHMLNRTSEREKMSYFSYETYRENCQNELMESIPEAYGDNRDFLPDEVSVIIAYYKSSRHLNWILENHKYNLRAGDDKGSIFVTNDLVNARYILLHNGKESTHFIKLLKKGPKVYTRAQLRKMGYPSYLKLKHDEFGNTITDANGEPVFIEDNDKEKLEANRIYLLFDLYTSNKAEPEFSNCYWVFPEGKFNTKPRTEKLSVLMRSVKRR